ncbi:MAG: thiamine phosphate synthase [Chloracidobacterium sp.]|nr:thiamine phosphate synthase [Chloracidobacterium sp.]
MNFELPRIYPITDVRISGLSHAEQVKRLIAGGATLIQLREKHASPRDFYEAAVEVIHFAKPLGVKIIINDRVDIAIALKADGVHLGQDDMPPDMARSILGNDSIIGFSTHTMEQVSEAMKFQIDYIAYGPVFPTQTKADPDNVVGLNELHNVRSAIGDIPLVAIGGINEKNLLSVITAGADSAAMIGSIISETAKIESTIRRMFQLST